MRRYVGEGREGGSHTGHREAMVPQGVGEARVVTSVASSSRRLAMEMLEGKYRALVSSAVMGRYLPADVRGVELGVGVCGVSVAAPPAAEHHGAVVHRAPMHLPEVDSREVDLEGALVAECLQTHVTLNPLLASCRIDKGCAKIIEHHIKLSRGL